jgi:hypothetical protein
MAKTTAARKAMNSYNERHNCRDLELKEGHDCEKTE